ncbi:MAG: polysaccharide biosynthesis/export family protein [Robiginitomaculum sp.]
MRQQIMPRPVMMRPRPAPQGFSAPQARYGAPIAQKPRRAAKPAGLLGKILGRGADKAQYAGYTDRMRGARLPAYQMAPRMPHPLDRFARWENVEPQYTLYPGDQVDIVVGSAPELSRTLTVGPDGRVVMPMTEPVMAAGRTLKQVETEISGHLAKQLVDPRINITPRAYAPQQVFVGGQVGTQGTYTLPGPVGVMEAILMAGGFNTASQTRQVVILRRSSTGNFMARTIDFRDGLQNPMSLADNVQLRRGDIIFVPRSNISEIGLFMQQYVREALPVTLGLSYNIGGNNNN